jgi:minor extracellular serine protease Vpr
VSRRLWSALFVLCASLLLATPARAAGPAPAGATLPTLGDLMGPAEAATTPIAYVVELSGPTTLDLYRARAFKVGDAAPAARAALGDAFDTLAARQAPARAAVLASGAEIVDTYDTAMNGFLVRATAAQLPALRAAPGVSKVYRATTYYPTLSRAVPMIGADEVAQNLGFTGKSVHIAVIDTGVDYTHKALGGSGKAEDFQTIYKNADKPAPGFFPNDKVIGGYDFAGRYYTGGNSPIPDENPLDENGHGTHVSGIAAGGRWDEPTVYHGVAPDAQVIALKVFGGQGGTNLSTSAIEWAIEANLGHEVPGKAARVDVINMSLGSPFSYNVQEAAATIQRATEAGILVVVAAGNDGDVGFIAGSPCTSPSALCVASTVASGERGDQIQVIQGGSPSNLEATEASGELAKSIYEAGRIQAPLLWFGRACTGDPPAAGDATGKVALIERGACNFVEKLTSAATAGAVAAVVYNNEPGLITMGANPGDARASIPAFMIKQEDGVRLRQVLEGGGAIDTVLDPALKGSLPKDYLADTVSSFSSRGPGRNGEFKPNLSAPGSNIVAPRIASGDQPVALSGTSMATPMVAGSAAVIIQRLRDQGLAPKDEPLTGANGLGVSDVAGLLVNFTSPYVWKADNRTQDYTPLARNGSGRVDLSRAARGTTILRAGGLASLNFGIQQFDDTYIKEEPVVLRNLADRQRRFSLTVEFRDPKKANAGVKYTPMVGGNPAQRVSLSANSQATIRLKLEAAANQLLRYPIYGGQSAMNGDQRMAEAEYDAFLVATELGPDSKPLPGGDVSRLPIYFLPRGTSVIQAAPSPIVVDSATGRGPVMLTNIGAQPGRAELFAEWAEDPVEPDVNLGINVDHVGIRVGRDQNNQRTIEFAIHTAGQRYMPLESEVRIFIENDSDAAIDYAVLNRDLGAATGPSYNGQQAVLLVNLQSNGGSLRYFAGADLENRTLILPVAAADLGYGPSEPIKLHAVIAHLATFDNVPWDYIPDGGVDSGGNITSDRLYFDEANLGFSLDRWSTSVANEGLTAPVLTRRAVGGTGVLDKVLALFPQNLQRRDDFQVLRITTGSPPVVPNTPTPRYTDTPTPPPTATRTPLPTFTTGPTVTTGPSATATRTPRPVIPTPGDEVPRIYLPVARKGA